MFSGPSCLSSNVISRCAYETLMELPACCVEASKLLRFFSCIALPRKIVDIIHAFIHSSPLSRNLIMLECFMNVCEHNDRAEKF